MLKINVTYDELEVVGEPGPNEAAWMCSCAYPPRYIVRRTDIDGTWYYRPCYAKVDGHRTRRAI